MRVVAAVAVAAAAATTILTGQTGAAGAPATSLTVGYYPHGRQLGGAHVWRLACRPNGGSHPRVTAACRELAAHGSQLAPVKRPCVRALARRGAPEALVSGRIGTRRVDRLVRPVCDPALWSALHSLLTGN